MESSISDGTWLALALVLTALGATWTWYAWRRRGVASAVRGAGLTLLAPAAYLTDTLELAGDVAVDVGRWGRGLVLSPTVWVGIVLAGVAVLLLVVAGVLRTRGIGTAPAARDAGPPAETARRPGRTARTAGDPPPAPAPRRSGSTSAPVDDDLADIEEILRRRGIS